MPILALWPLIRRAWPFLVGAALLLALIAWHTHAVDAAYTKGATKQRAADTVRFEAATAAATAAQGALIDRTAAKSDAISKGTDHALAKTNAGIAGQYADLRLRWAEANSRRAGQDGAATVSDATGSTDLTSCAAQGWVAIDVASAAAEAADIATAKDDAWREWAAEQARAWPQ